METNDEIWRDVVGYEGLYQVSDQGRVKLSEGMIKRQGTNADGYKIVSLRKNGVTVTAQVHRLVAFAFVEGYRPGLVVNHINEQKDDNRACNLEWCTRAFNVVYNDANRKGRDKAMARKGISDKHVAIGRRFRELRTTANLKVDEAAQLAGVSYGYLSKIEVGMNGFSFDVIENIANVFGYTLELVKIEDAEPYVSNITTCERMGQRIKALRLMANMSQEQLAERAGLQRTHVSRIEAGKYDVTLETIQAIAEALGMTVDIIDPSLQDLAPLKRL